MRSYLTFAAGCFLVGAALSAISCSSSDPTSDPGGDAAALRNIDVTVIYPLPAVGQEDAMIKPGEAGPRGPLLSEAAFESGHVPELDERYPLGSDAARLASLRVLAIRFDPCPRVTAPPPAGTTCQPEIRLVFQSLREDGGRVHARDGAIHAFYRLSPVEWRDVLTELRATRAEQVSQPRMRLDVHPLLASEGPRGPYAERLRGRILAYAGERNLVRITHFRRFADVPRWNFAIRERDDGTWRSATIPTSGGAAEQSLITISGGRWDADVTPAPDPSLDTTKIFKVSAPAEERESFRSVVRALNPRVHSSESIDCAGCHIAPDIAVFVENRLPIDGFEERFQSRYSLDAAHKSVDEAFAFDNIHMLSYSGTSLSVSHRVANETAAVLEALDGH